MIRCQDSKSNREINHKYNIYALKALSHKYNSIDSAASRIAKLSGRLTRTHKVVHLLSDIHGEHKKLRHILSNGSGQLRYTLDKYFSEHMTRAERREIQKLIQYPREMLVHLKQIADGSETWVEELARIAGRLVDCLRMISKEMTSVREVLNVLDNDYKPVLVELIYADQATKAVNDKKNRSIKDMDQEYVRKYYELDIESYSETVFRALFDVARFENFIGKMTSIIQNLLVSETVVVGDVYDRGARADLCMDYLIEQGDVWITWGNHDIAWLGAFLGQPALVAFVLRISCRYNQLSQIDEGYSISLQPLERLANTVYGNDPCLRHQSKRKDKRSGGLVARMHKAIAIIQYKLDGQCILRNSEWGVDDRALLHRINWDNYTITLEGKQHELLDKNWPTVDPKDPYKLSKREQDCMQQMISMFQRSVKMKQHMEFMLTNGSMYAVRDSHLLFHACLPVNKDGSYQNFKFRGKMYGGKDLCAMVDRQIRVAVENPTHENCDLLFYLWSGPISPMYGKAKMATLERDFIKDKTTWKEQKNAYFELMHDKEFCEKVLSDFGCDPTLGFIVNGHVPVDITKGEDPVKRSRKAVHIDGAFSEAYGDKGYTMVLKPEKTYLIEHSNFPGIPKFLEGGDEAQPKVVDTLMEHKERRTLNDDEAYRFSTREEITYLKALVQSYRTFSVRKGGVKTMEMNEAILSNL